MFVFVLARKKRHQLIYSCSFHKLRLREKVVSASVHHVTDAIAAITLFGH